MSVCCLYVVLWNHNNLYHSACLCIFASLYCDIIIIIHHELGLNRPVSASSNSLFKCLPSRLRPFFLYLSINFGILLLFILVTCRSQFDVYILCFLSAASTFKYSKIPSFLLWSKSLYFAVLMKNSISTDVSLYSPFLSEGSSFASQYTIWEDR